MLIFSKISTIFVFFVADLFIDFFWIGFLDLVLCWVLKFNLETVIPIFWQPVSGPPTNSTISTISTILGMASLEILGNISILQIAISKPILQFCPHRKQNPSQIVKESTKEFIFFGSFTELRSWFWQKKQTWSLIWSDSLRNLFPFQKQNGQSISEE